MAAKIDTERCAAGGLAPEVRGVTGKRRTASIDAMHVFRPFWAHAALSAPSAGRQAIFTLEGAAERGLRFVTDLLGNADHAEAAIAQ